MMAMQQKMICKIQKKSLIQYKPLLKEEVKVTLDPALLTSVFPRTMKQLKL